MGTLGDRIKGLRHECVDTSQKFMQGNKLFQTEQDKAKL